MTNAEYSAWLDEFPSAQYFAAGFIEDYDAELEMHRKYVAATNKTGLTDSVIAEYLVDIGDYEDFDAGNIVLPDADLDPNPAVQLQRRKIQHLVLSEQTIQMHLQSF